MTSSHLSIHKKKFSSRLFLGTGKYASLEQMTSAAIASGTNMATLAIRRIDFNKPHHDISGQLSSLGIDLLPNTSGAHTAKEALNIALMAREMLNTNWVKLEIHPEPRYLLPDPIETHKACELLVQHDFVVLPYVNADPLLCKRLEEVGAAAVMPLGSPIGSNQGLQTRAMLEIIIEQSNVPVIIDAGIGSPSQAAAAMEMGADAVLINTAIAVAENPTAMASAFNMAVASGHIAHQATLAHPSSQAQPTSDWTSFLDASPAQEPSI